MRTQWDKHVLWEGTDRWSEEPSLRTDNWWRSEGSRGWWEEAIPGRRDSMLRGGKKVL